MIQAFIGIGIPRSGKTDALRQIAQKQGAAFVSAGEIRSQYFDRGTDQSLNEVVWKELYRQVQQALDGGQDVVIDASNARVEDRRDLAAHCRKSIGYTDEVIGVWFDIPLETCLKRNRQMGAARMPDYVIRNLAQELIWNPPKQADGFDKIRIIKA